MGEPVNMMENTEEMKTVKQGEDGLMLVFLLNLAEEKTAVFDCITHLTQDPESGLSDIVLAPVLSSNEEIISESIRIFFNEQTFTLIFLDRTQLQLLPLLPYNLLSVGMKMSNNSQVSRTERMPTYVTKT